MSLTQPHPIHEQTSKLTLHSGFSTAVLRRAPAVLAGTMLAIVGMAIAPATIAKDGQMTSTGWVHGVQARRPQAVPSSSKARPFARSCDVSIGGKRVRVRLSNAFGAGKLVIGAAHVALRSTGAAIAAGSDRMLTFNGSPSTAIPPGALAVSDPVNLQVPDLGDLAVSIYVAGNQVAATEHSLGLQTTYISAEGISAAPTACRRRPRPSPFTF